MQEMSYDELIKDKIINYIAARCFFGQNLELLKNTGYCWVTAEQIQKYEKEIQEEINRRENMIKEKMTEVEIVKEIVFNISCGVTSLEYLKKNGSVSIYGMSDYSAEQVQSLEDKIVSEMNRQKEKQAEDIAKFLKDYEEHPEKYSDAMGEMEDIGD